MGMTGSTVAPKNSKMWERHTDLGNAKRLVERYGKDLRYCRAWKKWLVWDGLCWREDDTGEIDRLAKDTARSIYSEAGGGHSADHSNGIARWAKASESGARIREMIRLAETEPGIAIRPDDLDRDLWLLGLTTGTLDLHTGSIRPPDRADLIAKLAPVGYDPDARCPLWDLFLMEIMEGKPHLVRFLQRAVGYSLTGDTTERNLFVLYGEGANGKTTFLEIIRSLLGDYARGTPVDTLLIKRSSGANNDVAGLKGSRFVTASESGQGKHLDEAQVKQLTGGDTITARFLYGEWFEFHPQFKIWLATNHKPSIRRTDPAIWDRIRLIPFRVRIPEVRRDKNLREKLCEELPGILSWAVKGCLEWQKQGLGVPDEVREATAAYKDEMDVFGNFVTECCVLEPEAWVKTGDLKQEYNDWARENGERNLPNRKEFADDLKSRGCTSERRNTGRGWRGIRIMTL